MSGKAIDQQGVFYGERSTDAMACGQPCHPRTSVQTFDLAAAFRRPFNLHDDDDGDTGDADCAQCSDCSDDFISVTGSSVSSSTVPPGVLRDTVSISSNDSSFSLYDPEDDVDDRCSISTLENDDDGDDLTSTDVGTATTASKSVDGEDLEFNFAARTASSTVYRSASLKSAVGSRHPCSPRTKKVVRFADALGLDLESIRHILDVSDAPPTALGLAPPSVSARLRLMARFAEPGSSIDFLRRVQERKVSLEEVSVDAERCTVSGVIRVANVAYQKQVTVRYSADNWSTYSDRPATYLPPGGANTRYDGGLTDAFTFQLYLPAAVLRGGRLEFSVKYVVGADLTFWDSNFGANYAIDCVPT